MRHSGISFVCLVAGLCSVPVIAQEARPNLSGKWQFNAGKSELHSGKTNAVSLVIENKGPSIHVTKTVTASGKDSVIEFNCSTDGQDCNAKGAKVSLWFDGASLVEMDVAGDAITKSSMKLAAGGKTITLTVSYISPKAESDMVVLDKM
jgi:hypothetical protein